MEVYYTLKLLARSLTEVTYFPLNLKASLSLVGGWQLSCFMSLTACLNLSLYRACWCCKALKSLKSGGLALTGLTVLSNTSCPRLSFESWWWVWWTCWTTHLIRTTGAASARSRPAPGCWEQHGPALFITQWSNKHCFINRLNLCLAGVEFHLDVWIERRWFGSKKLTSIHKDKNVVQKGESHSGGGFASHTTT